ncbi:hypothetical protein ACIPSE_44750 [Streptomyces sp. NPDC090106]|uniref:hypothetical protein n=1 Tax=Streptomyces sp. NPDC090106 TaxID=3365946 RepID=UPI00381BA301
MPSVVLRHEAGPRSDGLAKELERLSAETMPAVEAVTGLNLPDPVVVRTMSIAGYAVWAVREAIAKLFGEMPPSGTSRYVTVRFRNAVGHPRMKEARAHALAGADAVASIISVHGLGAFNAVWSAPSFVPLRAETLDSSAAWRARFTAPRPA